jgi:glutathione S-transferase
MLPEGPVRPRGEGLDWNGEELDLRAGDQLRPEFLKINSKGLVLVYDGTVIPESNVILEYLEDAFPESPLIPADPVGWAKARLWMRRLDDVFTLTRWR